MDIHVTINDTSQNKVSADQYHVTISRAQVCSSSRSRYFFKSTADQVLVFDWIAGSCHVNLFGSLLTIAQEKIYLNYNFFFYTNVFCCFVLSIW